MISETLGHSGHSFTADTYISVPPEVSKAAAAAVVPRMAADDVTGEAPVPPVPTKVVSPADRRGRQAGHAGWSFRWSISGL
ncbi:hypothetical protein [Actinomadura yumaensis]|uniref:Integrase n=1 Tax=Actinomadura yumaensis TaxID=111807 RepID=A0ABW2CF29_9ACTN